MENKIDAPDRYDVQNGFTIRRAEEFDIPRVTELIHRAFDVWKDTGLTLSPMFQTESQTRRHLLPNGFVVEKFDKEIVGTFSLNTAIVSRLSEKAVLFREADDEPVEFMNHSGGAVTDGGYLVFKKAAVLSEYANQKLGQKMMTFCDQLTGNYVGIALETVAEAGWLYQWYQKLGFKTVGSYRYPKSQLETLLMLKQS